MEKYLEEILKSDVLNEETKGELKKQFAIFVENVRDQARKDVAEQYKRDREKLINVADKMISESLKKHMDEFANEFKHLDRLKKQAAKAVVEADKNSQKKVAKAIAFMESKMTDLLQTEMSDLLQDRRTERKAVAEALKEAKARSERDHQEFISKGAQMLDFIIEKEIKTLIKSLRKDIIAARQNNFGRKIYEAFVADYETTLFSHDKHARKLKTETELLSKKYSKLKEAARKEIVALRKQVNESKQKTLVLEEKAVRNSKMNSLLKNLKGSSRDQMRKLLESAPTNRMDQTFKKFLPVVTESVTSRGPSKERTLGSLHTGVKRTLNETARFDDDTDESIVLLQKRAGLKK